MKRIVLAALLLFPALAFSQKMEFRISDFYPIVNGKIVYTDVVTVDSAKATDLYLRGKVALANLFKDSQEVIQVADESKLLIVGKGSLVSMGHNPFVGSPRYHFTITLQFKDGRYKYLIDDIKYSFIVNTDKHYKDFTEFIYEMDGNEYKKKQYERVAEYNYTVGTDFENMVKSLIKEMNVASKTIDDNW